MLEITTFHKIIQQVDTLQNESKSDEAKLNHAGNLFCQGSMIILHKAQQCLDHELRPKVTTTEEDTHIDESFTSFLHNCVQQSISTNFLNSYLIPQLRTKYQREIDSTPITIIENSYSELKTAEWEFSYDENIEEWAQKIKNLLETKRFYTLSNIVKKTNLSQTQVFMSLLMMEIELNWTGDFYESEINIRNR
jgi:hypothetical protein